MQSSEDDLKRGYVLGIACYLIWGGLPIYFKALTDISPAEIVAQRVLWSVVLLLGIVALRKDVPSLIARMQNPRLLGILTVTSLLIGMNWTLYVWAVANEHILAASLGYFLNPLVNVALGVIVLKERLRRPQMVAIAFALGGVINLSFAALDTLWISAILACSFGFYGLLRKTAPVESLPGLTIETLILLPIAAAYLGWLSMHGAMGFGQHTQSTLLLILLGAVSTIPLLLFTQAARLLPLATLGVLQYLAPSIQFLIGLLLYKEPLSPAKLISFVLIWIGLIIFTHDALRDWRRQAAARTVSQKS